MCAAHPPVAVVAEYQLLPVVPAETLVNWRDRISDLVVLQGSLILVSFSVLSVSTNEYFPALWHVCALPAGTAACGNLIVAPETVYLPEATCVPFKYSVSRPEAT